MSPFQEIAFKAELDRHIDPECEEQARILCGEEPATRASVIEELRKMIYGKRRMRILDIFVDCNRERQNCTIQTTMNVPERGECHPPRMDDAFLLRFLRARRSIPARAHRLVGSSLLVPMTQLVNLELILVFMVRYCTFREQNPHLWRDIYWYGLNKMGDVFEAVLFDRPDVGRLIICRVGRWDPNVYPVEDLVRGCLLFLEAGIMQPKLQVLGGTALVDCEGMSLQQMRQLTPSVAVQIINILGFAFPLYQRGLHVINCSKFFEKLFNVFKRFAPNDELWKIIHFHGYDLKSLHRLIDPECLPKRYGGHRESISVKVWLDKIKEYKTKEFDEDMRTLGYAVDQRNY